MPRYSINKIQDFKNHNIKFATLTAYDYTSAKLLDRAGIPLILVGDSASMVMYGYDTTIPVSMDEMLLVTSAVVKGSTQALIVADMPFMSYQTSIEKALENAGKFIKDAGAGAVKLEGGSEVCNIISAITKIGIPVVGHIGLKPQSFHQTSGYKVQGKSLKDAEQIISDAYAVENAGAFAIVLEGIPAELAKKITNSLSIPTIGIGAGPHCNGQIQVLHDILGLFDTFVPKHAKQFSNIGDAIIDAVTNYQKDVTSGEFPTQDNYVLMDQKILKKL